MGLEEKFNSESALKYIKSEVEYWDHYAQGNTFLFSLENKNGENIECIGGFIGHYDDVTAYILSASIFFRGVIHEEQRIDYF